MDESNHRRKRDRLNSWRAILVVAMWFALVISIESAVADENTDCPDAASVDTLLSVVHEQFHGRILTLALENKDGKCVYEIKWLTPAGQVRRLYYDAENLMQLKVIRPDLEEDK